MLMCAIAPVECVMAITFCGAISTYLNAKARSWRHPHPPDTPSRPDHKSQRGNTFQRPRVVDCSGFIFYVYAGYLRYTGLHDHCLWRRKQRGCSLMAKATYRETTKERAAP